MGILLLTTMASAQTEVFEIAAQTGQADWWTAIVKQSPSLAILAFIVYVFFKHLEKRDAQLKYIGIEYREHQKEMTATVKEVANALGAYHVTFGRLEKAVEKIEDHNRQWRTPQ